MPSYTASDIEVLNGLEAIRTRASMYLGDMGQAFHQIVYEVIANSCDEWTEGYGNWVYVHMDTESRVVTVADNGRGIPVDIHPEQGIPALTVVLTHIHSGGKFSRKTYKSAQGTYGVGIKATNAVSESMEAYVIRDGALHGQFFAKGDPTTEVFTLPDGPAAVEGCPPVLHSLWDSQMTGTVLRFQPDFSIIHGKAPVKSVRKLCQLLAYLCPGMTFQLGIDDLEPEVYTADTGLEGYVQELIEAQKEAEPSGPAFVYRDEFIDVCLQWTTGNGCLDTFANRSATPEGGRHLTGFKRAIGTVLAGFVPNGNRVNREDFRDGMIGAFHVIVKNPEFQGQVKHKLVTEEAEQLVVDRLSQPLQEFFAHNRKLTDQIIAKAIKLQSLRDKSQADRDTLRKVTFTTRSTRSVLPGKLAQAPYCKPHERELFICEGDSAAGTLKQARDNSGPVKYQEVLPLKGKPPNALRAKTQAVLSNEDLRNLIASIGGGLMDDCHPAKTRVGKVILMMDADHDGRHIDALTLTFLSTYMRPLIDAGMVYAVNAPLYIATSAKGKFFGQTLKEVQQAAGKGAMVSRAKGWGEVNATDLRMFSMDPATRSLSQVVVPDGDHDQLTVLMGADASLRKQVLGLA